MKEDDILTDEEKRFLSLSARPSLTLQEELEFASLKKKQNYKQIKDGDKHALTAGVVTALMLPTAFMPHFVLPVAVCMAQIGYLAHMEKTYFKKVKAKANYYFNELNVNAQDEKYKDTLDQNRQNAFNFSNSLSDRANAVDRFSRQLERIDLDRKNGLAHDLKEEYFSLNRFRVEILAMSAASLVAGLFLPQMAFLSFCVAASGLSVILAKADASTIRQNRLLHWEKKEEILKAQLQTKMRSFENQPVEQAENQVQKVSHHQKQKMPDTTRQKDD